ncbi:MAG TPA: metallophosphoesterase [Solirubrobacteraceae bacterium]|jgi:hypothetical protein|nr:metallophosphoesterase [Solirubrobacteraceae bacterium]
MKVVSHRTFATPVAALAEPSALESGGDPLADAALRAAFTDALDALEAEQRHEGILSSPRHQIASLLQTYAAENPPPQTQPTGLEVKFDTRDLGGWIRSFFDWWRRLRPAKWRAPADEPERVGDGRKLRVGLLADWGTGMYGAPVCAKSLQDDGDYQLLMHLGDVYYSGTEHEVRENFLPFWPKIPGAVTRCLNSNHEMYGGGWGLFNVAMPEFGQAASPCAVMTDDWLLVGLDTGYDDNDLAGDQGRWVEGLVGRAGERRVILFSHHQPFSLLSGQGPKLVSKLDRLLTGGRIFAWYWGHEHRCVLYDRHAAWNMHGRCIGHGGMPYFRDDVRERFLPEAGDERWLRLPGRNLVPGGLLLDTPNPYIQGHEDDYGPNGYMTLELDGPRLRELVHAPDGEILREQALA